LGLRGRRADGFHWIESLFVPVTLFDRLAVSCKASSRAEIQVISESPLAPSGSSNLIFRAADVFRRRTGQPFSLTVRLQKRIPVGSGLGGGSSNAAAILGYLNSVMGWPFDQPTLAATGLEVGADVPFFVYGQPAVVRGVGEVVIPLAPARLPPALVVCWSGAQLSTAAVYARTDQLSDGRQDASLTTKCPESNIADFVEGQRPLAELLANDLEEAAAQICPEVRHLKGELLSLGAEGASMTGSGSAVFGVCSNLESAERIAVHLRRKGLWACSIKILTTSSR
jgi:4-diphosphocytidyl-2-C-methyl-D-erythritol kinase